MNYDGWKNDGLSVGMIFQFFLPPLNLIHENMFAVDKYYVRPTKISEIFWWIDVWEHNKIFCLFYYSNMWNSSCAVIHVCLVFALCFSSAIETPCQHRQTNRTCHDFTVINSIDSFSITEICCLPFLHVD